MRRLSFKHHRHGADVIRQAVWLYFRFSLSLRDVEEILAERGVDVSYEAIRMWVRKFGPQIARNLKRLRPAPSSRWHLDEMVSRIAGQHMYLWRAVDDEGEVLATTVAKRRDATTATSFIQKLLRDQPVSPTAIVTDGSGRTSRPLMPWASRTFTTPDGLELTTALKTPTCRSVSASDGCRGSSLRSQRSGF